MEGAILTILRLFLWRETGRIDKVDETEVRKYLKKEYQTIQLDVRETVDSTNTLLIRKAKDGCPEIAAAIAAEQTAGKGRRGRSFYSPVNTGVYLSLLLRPKMEAAESLSMTTAAAVAVSVAIEKVFHKPVRIKWVNDVYCEGKKVVGILTEAAARPGSSMLDYAVVGIGVNIWEPEGGFPEEIRQIAGSILKRDERRKEPVRSQIAAEILNQFLDLYPSLGKYGYMEEYRQRSMVLGQQVKILDVNHEPVPGEPYVTVKGIGDHAELFVEYPDGHQRTLLSGEVSIRPKEM